MSEVLSSDIPPDVDTLVETVLKEACKRELKLATAESCTGGLLASLLTNVEGCSHAFERGFVTYTNEAKNELLGIPSELLEEPGPVSEAVARAMAQGALSRSRADIGVAITGFAGRGAPDEEPGLVYVAVAQKGGPTACREERFGDVGREEVRRRCLHTALYMLHEALEARPR